METVNENHPKDTTLSIGVTVRHEADKLEEKSDKDNHLSQGSKCLYTQLDSKMHCEGK